MSAKLFLVAATLMMAATAFADDAEVVRIEAEKSGDSYRFSVTLRHGDTGWDDYADAWRVELEDGTVIGERILLHPHETEQPFTRSQDGIAVPKGAARVYVRTRTTRTEWSGTRAPFDF